MEFKKGRIMNQRYQELYREEFEKLMQRKTGWGRVEIMSAFDRASAIAALRLLDEKKIH
jgi:hypothetical protein